MPDQPNDSDQQPDGVAADDAGGPDSDESVLDDAGQPTPRELGEPSG